MTDAHSKFSRVTEFAFPYVLVLITIMFVLTVFTSFGARDTAKTADHAAATATEVAGQNKAAICALQSDLHDRIDQGREFLRRNPDGAFGFTQAEIKLQIENQQRTLRSLSVVEC